jgi:hypothetical protein
VKNFHAAVREWTARTGKRNWCFFIKFCRDRRIARMGCMWPRWRGKGSDRLTPMAALQALDDLKKKV